MDRKIPNLVKIWVPCVDEQGYPILRSQMVSYNLLTPVADWSPKVWEYIGRSGYRVAIRKKIQQYFDWHWPIHRILSQHYTAILREFRDTPETRERLTRILRETPCVVPYDKYFPDHFFVEPGPANDADSALILRGEHEFENDGEDMRNFESEDIV
mgnify:CR=1 FL=1